MTMGSSPKLLPKRVLIWEVGKENNVWIWLVILLVPDFLGPFYHVRALVNILLHQPPVLWRIWPQIWRVFYGVFLVRTSVSNVKCYWNNPYPLEVKACKHCCLPFQWLGKVHHLLPLTSSASWMEISPFSSGAKQDPWDWTLVVCLLARAL